MLSPHLDQKLEHPRSSSPASSSAKRAFSHILANWPPAMKIWTRSHDFYDVRRRELSSARLSISTASGIVLDRDTPNQESPDESLYDAYDEYEKYDEYNRYDKYDKCDM